MENEIMEEEMEEMEEDFKIKVSTRKSSAWLLRWDD